MPIPAGWIPFDDIASRVGSRADQYPELYRHLSAKYGNIRNVPKVGDRFLRNAGEGLRVGEKQEDAIRNITGNFGPLDNGNNQGMRSMLDGAFYLIEGDTHYGLGTDWNNNNPLVGFDASRVVPTANENRPKSLILKLCIKAQNSFDDVKFWVKAFGSIDNEGVLDASQLAQGLQGKAERNHTHTVSQITDFNQKADERIHAVFNYQRIGNFEVRKYPDGTMIQTCLYRRGEREYNRNYYDNEPATIMYPIAFVHPPILNVTPHLSHPYFDSMRNDLTTNDKTKRLGSAPHEANDGAIGLTIDCNNTQCQFVYQNSNVYISEMTFHILAIGRWK